MRYLLDTNIIGNITKLQPSGSLLASMSEQDDEDLFTASMTVAEIRRGVLEYPPENGVTARGLVWRNGGPTGALRRPRSSL